MCRTGRWAKDLQVLLAVPPRFVATRRHRPVSISGGYLTRHHDVFIPNLTTTIGSAPTVFIVIPHVFTDSHANIVAATALLAITKPPW